MKKLISASLLFFTTSAFATTVELFVCETENANDSDRFGAQLYLTFQPVSEEKLDEKLLTLIGPKSGTLVATDSGQFEQGRVKAGGPKYRYQVRKDVKDENEYGLKLLVRPEIRDQGKKGDLYIRSKDSKYLGRYSCTPFSQYSLAVDAN